MPESGSTIVGLDIGTTKTVAVLGEVSADGVDVTGVGEARSKGLRKGVVVNIESTVGAIREAIDRASNMAGIKIESVYAGVAGSHVRGLNSHGIVSIAQHEVSSDDVSRVLDQARQIQIPLDRQVIHVLPQDYVVDQQDGVREPVGMSGVRLEAKVHLVTAAVSSLQNVTKCVERCGLRVEELVLEPLASAEAVLSDDEKEIGVALVDIGGGTTDVVVYVDGSLVLTAVFPVGGMNLTHDIATGLRTPEGEAERLKLRYACGMSAMVDPDDMIEVPGVGGRAAQSLSRQVLATITEPRMEEIFHFVAKVLEESGNAELLGAGVVVTGGASLLEGTLELAENVLKLPVRLGAPSGVGGMVEMVRSPAMATAVGLLKYGAARPVRVPAEAMKTGPGVARAGAELGVGSKLWSWLKEVL